jgi:hypothetical protein
MSQTEPSAAELTARVEEAQPLSSDEHKLRQVVDLQAEIESERRSIELMDERRQVIVDRVAMLQKKLEELQA